MYVDFKNSVQTLLINFLADLFSCDLWQPTLA